MLTEPFRNMDTVIHRFEAAACFLRQRQNDTFTPEWQFVEV